MKRSFHVMAKVIDFTSNAGCALSALVIIAMGISVFYEIVMRGMFDRPTTWVLEYSEFMLVAGGFLGAAWVAKMDGHVSVDFFTSRLSDRTRIYLDFVCHLWSIGFSLILVRTTLHMVSHSYRMGRVTTSLLETPTWIPEIPVFIGSLFLAMELIRGAAVRLSQLRKMETFGGENETFMKSVDKPVILIPLLLLLLALGSVLFSQGGGLQVAGLILLMLVLLASGTPVFMSLSVLGSFGLFVVLGGGLGSQQQIGFLAFKSLHSFTLEAIPLFVMSAGLFSITGLTEKLYAICNSWLSWLPGNLAMATIPSCAIFAAISGSSVATAATIGMIAIPAMMKYKYDSRLALGTVAAGGTLGILIPPSLSFLMIGAITETSVGQLFIAGVVPGLFLSLVFMGYLYIKTRKDPRYKPGITPSWGERMRLLVQGIPVLAAPVIMIGGIYIGIFTPTEAAAVSLIYAAILGLVTGKLGWRKIFPTIAGSVRSAVMVLMLIFGAKLLGFVITILQIPQGVTEFVVNSTIPAWGIVILMNVLLLVLGMFLECASITVITVPILFPPMMALGFDPLWFGVIFTINMELALITPPVGLNLYVLTGTTTEKLETVIRGALPYVIILAICLAVVALIEPMSTWLPSTMMK